LGTGPAGQVDAEQAVEAGDHLAVGQAGLLVEQDDGGLGVGAELAGGGAGGVGGLQRVPPLDAMAAPLAVADVDVELAVERLTGDLGLVLGDDLGLDDGAAAAGAGVGQGGVEGLVDPLGGRGQAVAVPTVGDAGLAAGGLGVGLGGPLAEGGGLALAGAAGLVEEAAQFLDLGFDLGEALAQAVIVGLEPLVLVPEVIEGRPGHAGPRAGDRRCSLRSAWGTTAAASRPR
jgi:hypothetical protein